MAIPVILPRQGQSVETCAIIAWKKRVGDTVRTGEILCEVETDKASFEIESPADGKLLAIYRDVGSQVPVLETIASIGAPGEEVGQLIRTISLEPDGQPEARSSKAIPDVTAALSAPAATPSSRKIAASPRARALAAASSLSLTGIHGTGPGGRIVEKDVKQVLIVGQKPASVQAVSGGPPTATQPAASILGGVREIKVTGIRKLIAERMLASLSTTAQLTLTSSANARALQELRAKLKESPESLGLRSVTINDMMLFAVSRALAEHPEMNAHFTCDTIRQFADVHLGFAVDTPQGLIVPVIRNARALGLRAMAAEASRLATACRDGRIAPDALVGATFTVTNLGGLGVETFTPVLNPPQVGVIGVGAIVPHVAQGYGGSVVITPYIGLSLTINHQAVDGAPGARFLQTLAGLIARFDLLLAQ